MLTRCAKSLQPDCTGGRVAKVKTDSNNSDEEEEWFDATEELEASSHPVAGSWWEQDNVDAADVEAHLLRDIHEKGMQCHTLDHM